LQTAEVVHSPGIPQEYPKDSRNGLLRYGEYSRTTLPHPEEPIKCSADDEECPKNVFPFRRERVFA